MPSESSSALTAGLVANRAICSAHVYDSIVRGCCVDVFERERGVERRRAFVGDVRAARVVGIERQNGAAAFKIGQIDVLVDHGGGDRRVAMISQRGRFELAAQRGDVLAGVRNRFGRSDGGARRHHDAIRGKRDQRGGRIRARIDVRDHRHVCRKQRVANAERRIHQTARAVDVQDDRGGVLAIGFGNGAFDEMGHSVVDRPLDRHDHDLAGLGGRGGRAGGGSRQAANQQPQGDPSPYACYPHAPTYPSRTKRLLRGVLG